MKKKSLWDRITLGFIRFIEFGRMRTKADFAEWIREGEAIADDTKREEAILEARHNGMVERIKEVYGHSVDRTTLPPFNGQYQMLNYAAPNLVGQSNIQPGELSGVPYHPKVRPVTAVDIEKRDLHQLIGTVAHLDWQSTLNSLQLAFAERQMYCRYVWSQDACAITDEQAEGLRMRNERIKQYLGL